MKNILLIIISLVVLGCSNDDAPAPAADTYYFAITVKQQCPSTSSPEEKICVTENTHDQVKEFVREFRENFPNQECVSVTFNDINGVQVNGFFKQADRHVNHDPCAEN